MKIKKAVFTIGAGMLGTAAQLQAAVPAEVVTMFGDIETDASAIITTYVIPAVALITGLWVMIRMAKKGASKIG